nr:hypothetical protein [Tanacetum cinerariifolium]
VHDTQKTEGPLQSSTVSFDFKSKLLNLENVSPADYKIASLMETNVLHSETSSQISSLYIVPIPAIHEVATTIPPPPPFFNPLQHQTTPTTSKTTTSFPTLSDFSLVFKFNDRVTSLEKDLSEMKQVDQEEPLAEKKEYIDLIDTSVRTIIIEEAVASLLVFELPNILMDKMEENKSYIKVDYKNELYDALVKSYNTDKDLFDTYGEVFLLKRGRDDKDKDHDPSVRSARGTKRKKSSKEAESSKDLRLNEEEPSHTVDDSEVHQHQEFDTGNNDEQPDKEEPLGRDWYKKPERPLAPDLDWAKRQRVDFQLLVGPEFNILKGTCRSLTELEYHFEECFKATTERLDWYNPEGKPYPFDLRKPLPLIPDHRGLQVIPQDYFINNDLEYLKGGSLSRKYSLQ